MELATSWRQLNGCDEDGLWGTVLDYPEAYGEVSATAGIAPAMVMQGNPSREICEKSLGRHSRQYSG